MRWILALGLSLLFGTPTILAQTTPTIIEAPLEPVATLAPIMGGQTPLWSGSPPVPLQERTWVSAEYLLWTVRHGQVPPLATTGPQASGGVLGASGTSVLFGGDDADLSTRQGARFTGGFWFSENRHLGFEASGFFVCERSGDFEAASNGDPLLARPLFLAPGNIPSAEQVANLAAPGVAPIQGRLSIDFDSELWGAEGNFLLVCNETGWSQFDVFAGFRHVNLREGISIGENLNVPVNAVTGSGTFTIADTFLVENEFYGGQVGARYRAVLGCFDVRLQGRVAVGCTEQEVGIIGATQITPTGGTTQSFGQGILAAASNSGSYIEHTFSVVPEGMCEVGWSVSECTRLSLGYTFLYWSSVVRPGEQIDLVINPNLIPNSGLTGGPARPAFQYNTSDLIIQGLSCGFEVRY